MKKLLMTIILLMQSVLLSSCKNDSPIYHSQENDPVKFQTTCMKDVGYFYVPVDINGISFVDFGNGTNYQLKYHQLQDHSDYNFSKIRLVTYDEGKIIYSLFENEGMKLSIYSCNLDGTHEELITQYSKDHQSFTDLSPAILQDGKMYFSIRCIDFEEGQRESLVVLDLKERSIHTLIDHIISDGMSLYPIYIDQDYLYFQSVVDIKNNRFSSDNLVYRISKDGSSYDLLQDELDEFLYSMLLPDNGLFYYGFEPENDFEITFSSYDIKKNEIHKYQYQYQQKDTNKSIVLYPRGSFQQIVIFQMNVDDQLDQVIYYNPITQEEEVYDKDHYFIPTDQSENLVLGYDETSDPEYLFTIISKQDFQERKFEKGKKIYK